MASDALQESMKRQANKLGEVLAKTKDDKKLLYAAEEFESFFIYMLLKEMRKTVPKSELFHGGRAEEIWQDMMDEEIGKQIAHTPGMGLGIAEMIYRQLSRPNVIPASEVAKKNDEK
ncbi:MAG: rod-binding protein [bacterium]